ncbi:MAG: hypothetical protein GY820_17270 [Gammaproteobacteria bacterium]|nr:hypothetical protein [Gammaproteobacteria bacterium]
MSIENGETVYGLKRPIKYHSQTAGGETEATEILLREPSYQHAHEAWSIRQDLMSVVRELQVVAQAEEATQIASGESKPFHENTEAYESESEMLYDMLKEGIFMAKSIDIGAFVDKFIKMVSRTDSLKCLAMLNGETRLKQTHIESMSPDDVLGVALWWACFFAMPS